MRVLLIIFLLFSFSAIGQNSLGVSFRSGYDRIGLFLDPTVNLVINQHQVDLGIRYYGLDFVFEKNTVGLTAGYAYNIYAKNERTFFSPGIVISGFHETKSSTELLILDLMIVNKLGYEFSERFSIFCGLGFGAIIDNSKSLIGDFEQSLGYFNYEFNLGIKYDFKLFKNEKDKTDVLD